LLVLSVRGREKAFDGLGYILSFLRKGFQALYGVRRELDVVRAITTAETWEELSAGVLYENSVGRSGDVD